MNQQTPNVPRKVRTRALLGTALALALGGVLAGELTFLPSQNAQAQAVAVQPVQTPDFSDLVDKVTPAVVSVRVRENDAPQVAGLSPSDIPGLRNLPPGSPLDRFFNGPNGQGGQGGQGGQAAPNGRGGQGQNPPSGSGRSIGLGSGFFISDDGYVVTNNHVIDNASDFTVIKDDGTEYKATLVGHDDKTDLALLKVTPTGNQKFAYVKFSQDKPRVGQWAIAVGNPFGLGGTVTAGIVSALSRNIGSGPYDDYLQIDAAVNRGNSGGPTFNNKGEVIGINSAIYSPSGGNVGIAFAIPASTAERVIGQLRSSGIITRGWLGVQIQPVTQDIADSVKLTAAKGALVADPQSGGPAVVAGIKAGDVILSVDGKPIDAPRDLAVMIGNLSPNTVTKITVWRDGARQEIPVTLGTLPADQQQASNAPDTGRNRQAPAAGLALQGFGLTLSPSADGVLISSVDPNGKGADIGLQDGDVILAVGSAKVSRPADVEKAIADARTAKQKAVLVRVKSGSDTRYVALPIAAG